MDLKSGSIVLWKFKLIYTYAVVDFSEELLQFLGSLLIIASLITC